VILDPAPAQLDMPADLYSLVDIITPNETGQMVGFPVMSQIQLLRQQMFYGRGVGTAIVKLGAQVLFVRGNVLGACISSISD